MQARRRSRKTMTHKDFYTMMRKLALLLAALFLSATALSARPHPDRYSPYQHGYRWYFSLQGGPAILLSDNIQTYGQNGKGWDMLCWQAALSFGYNFTDAWDLRISGSYAYNAGAMLPYAGFYPYKYFAAQLFADMVLNYNALAEYNTPFNFKTYAGLGGAFTHGFSEVEHPFQELSKNNIVPGIRLGAIFEYDYKSGFGWFMDLGAEAFLDRYDGQVMSLPVDFGFKLSLGFIYHFPLR